MKEGGGSDMTNKMREQGVCVRDDGGSTVGNMGGSSTMATYFPKKEEKQMVISSVKVN